MQSRWSDVDARKTVDVLSALGVSEALALRIYTTRLLGSDPALVLHGGGNTSLKAEMADLLGETHAVLCVKGSGCDMASIDPTGFPAVKLAPLRKLRHREQLSDEDMVRVQRAYLLDPTAPTPSVEMLLHAFMPHACIDHTHANAVLSLIDWASCPMSDPDSALPKRPRRCSTQTPRSRASSSTSMASSPLARPRGKPTSAPSRW